MTATKKPAKPNREQRRGYVRERKVYALKFEDEEMEGLVVRARSVPLGTYLDLMDLAASLGRDTDTMAPEDARAIRKMFTGFGGALVEWNLQEPVLDDDGEETGDVEDVPANYEGLCTQEVDWALQVMHAWMDALAAVSGPLDPGSNGGGRSLEASLPMAPSSPSPAS